MQFLKNILSTVLGIFVFFIIIGVILVGLAVIAAPDDTVTVKENTVLHLDLDNVMLVERAPTDAFSLPGTGPFSTVASVGLKELKTAIRAAKEDDKIKGIYLQSGLLLSGGPAMLLEVRNELEDFKSSGKFIVSYSEILTEEGYFLSSVADEVYLNPLGVFEFNGLSANVAFLSGLFEKLDIEPVVFRVGEFKSAVEPFIREEMSEESRLQTAVFLNDLNNFALEKISESRQLPFEVVKKINDSMLVRKNEQAVEMGLIDGLWYEDEVRNLLRAKTGIDEDKELRTVNVTDLTKNTNLSGSSRNKIAVIVAEGDIITEDRDGSIGSDKFAEEIRKARGDDGVKAIVLRVNSPGGGLLASEVIWREVEEARKVKPVIASLSEVAASGGYYISAPADTIVAQPNTITGSIGVFGLWFNLKGFLNNKLGVTTDVVTTGEYSDFMNPTRQMSPQEKSIVQNQVEEAYETFITRVANGRGMTREQVKEVASGRVWSGIQAVEIGLVDVLGGLDDAINIAAEKAGVSGDFRVAYYPRQKDFFEKLMEDFSRDIEVEYIKSKLGKSYYIFQQIERAKDYEGIMMRLPYDLEVK